MSGTHTEGRLQQPGRVGPSLRCPSLAKGGEGCLAMWLLGVCGCRASHSLQEFLEEKPINSIGEQKWEILNVKKLNAVPTS